MLGVSDDTRQRTLRYRIAGEADFLCPPSYVPKVISLPELLGADDGEHRDCADIVAGIRDHARSPVAEHRELFDRVVVSVGIGNTDDHLRYHGFFAEHGAWSLSAARALERIAGNGEVLSTWREAARRHGISEQEITLMAEGIEPPTGRAQARLR